MSDDAHREISVFRLEAKPSVGITWSKVVERNARPDGVWILFVDALDLEKCEIPFPRFWRTHLSADEISREKAKPLYLRRRNVDVIRSCQIAVILAS